MAEERSLSRWPKKKLKAVRQVSNCWSSGGEKVAFCTFSRRARGAKVDLYGGQIGAVC